MNVLQTLTHRHAIETFTPAQLCTAANKSFYFCVKSPQSRWESVTTMEVRNLRWFQEVMFLFKRFISFIFLFIK